jgi:adenosine deaminase
VLSRPIIEKLPKTDLHVHLDGSIRLETLIDLAREYRIELPSYSTDGLKDLVFKDHYENLVDYLRGFQYTVAVLQSELATRASLVRVSAR